MSIGSNGQDGKKKPLRVAAEDALVIFFYSLFVILIASLPGFPTLQDVYAATIISGAAGILSWAKARNIQVGPTG